MIALAIQGMTPDPRDLTSGSISRILQSILNVGIPGAVDEARPGDDGPDEKPDEVCTPAVAGRLVTRGRVDRPYPPHAIPLSPRGAGADLTRPPCHREAATTCRHLASLGRFVC